MKPGDKVEATNDNDWSADWIYLAKSQGYYICRNAFSGTHSNFRYIRPEFSFVKTAEWNYETITTGRLKMGERP